MGIHLKLALVAAVILSWPFAATAQVGPPSSVRFAETAMQVDGKMQDLSQRKMPTDVSGVIAEKAEVEAEISRVQARISAAQFSADESLSEADVAALKVAASAVRQVDCRNAAASQAAVERFIALHMRVDSNTRSSSPFSAPDSAPTCDSLKRDLGNADEKIDAWVSRDLQDAKRAGERQKLTESYIKYDAALQKRRSGLNEKLKELEERQGLTSNFIWFIILFGGLSLGAMFIVTRFDTELQMEWVSSGQVTQFVTVMILLIVITMLGLSQTITGETLGTLLGGVAGYVLAQGVGRAAARDAARNAMQGQQRLQ